MTPLKTIRQILSDLKFLEYSTRKRNLGYQIQYLEFKINILKSGTVYGSVKACLMREIIINVTNIIEYFLFIALRTIYSKDPKSHKFPQLIGQSRQNNLISKNLAGDLNKINELRNSLHPSKQKIELDVKIFTKKEVYFALSALRSLETELNEAFRDEPIQIEVVEDQVCAYEGYSQVLFSDFHCPYCGGFHM